MVEYSRPPRHCLHAADPSENEGRRMARAGANAQAARDIARRRKAKLLDGSALSQPPQPSPEALK